jgi:autotransporter-associated beta strand protein
MKTTTHRAYISMTAWTGAIVAAVFAAALGSSPVLHAATRTWQGDYSGYWSAAQNWAENISPTDGDDLVFPAGAVLLQSTNNLGNRPFRSLTISGNGYTLRGSPTYPTITLTHGISATYISGVSTVEFNVDLAASQSFECLYSTADLLVTGNLNLASHTLTTVGAGEVMLGGVLSGTGGLVKTGSGTHWLQGSSANTYSGETLVRQGTLLLAKPSGNAVQYGSLVIGDGVGGSKSAVVREQASYQIGNIPVTLQSDGWLDVGDYLDTVGAMIFDGGTASSTGGRLSLGGGVTVSSNGGTISGALGLGSVTRLFDIASPGNLRVDATVSGTGGITKTNSGFLTLVSSNSYSGTTTVQGGYVEVQHGHALGATTAGTVLKTARCDWWESLWRVNRSRRAVANCRPSPRPARGPVPSPSPARSPSRCPTPGRP